MSSKRAKPLARRWEANGSSDLAQHLCQQPILISVRFRHFARPDLTGDLYIPISPKTVLTRV
jgi:hypothetical protein